MENRNPRLLLLVTCALLIALGVVLKLFAIAVSPALRLSFALVSPMTAGILFGPASGFLVGALTDVFGFALRPTGAYTPVTTLMYAFSGVIPALFVSSFSLRREEREGRRVLCYSRTANFDALRTYWRLQIGVLVSQVLCSMLLNTYGQALLLGKAFIVLLAARWPASLLMAFVYPGLILLIVTAYRAALRKQLPATSLCVKLGRTNPL